MDRRDDHAAFALYLDEVRQIPLLTAAEEQVLGRAVREGVAAEQKMAGPHDPEERAELLERRRRGLEARQRMVRANLRLVISVAKKFTGSGMPLGDLVQEGSLGLMHAVEKFDHRRGFKFSTYATWWVRQAVGRAVHEQGRTIRLPVHLQEQMRKAANAERALAQTLGREVGVEEVAAAMGEPAEKLTRMRDRAVVVVSLDAPVGALGDTALGEQIADPGAGVEEEYRDRERRQALEAVLDRLPVREAAVLRHRLGLVDGRRWTLAEVGRVLGVTRERARQVEALGMRRLREPEHAALLRALLG